MNHKAKQPSILRHLTKAKSRSYANTGFTAGEELFQNYTLAHPYTDYYLQWCTKNNLPTRQQKMNNMHSQNI